MDSISTVPPEAQGHGWGLGESLPAPEIQPQTRTVPGLQGMAPLNQVSNQPFQLLACSPRELCGRPSQQAWLFSLRCWNLERDDR